MSLWKRERKAPQEYIEKDEIDKIEPKQNIKTVASRKTLERKSSR